MRGSKAKKLRRIARALGKDLPEVEYEVDGHHEVQHPLLGMFLWPKTRSMGPCQRRMYKTMKARLA